MAEGGDLPVGCLMEGEWIVGEEMGWNEFVEGGTVVCEDFAEELAAVAENR